jgi:hypothetical protein
MKKRASLAKTVNYRMSSARMMKRRKLPHKTPTKKTLPPKTLRVREKRKFS